MRICSGVEEADKPIVVGRVSERNMQIGTRTGIELFVSLRISSQFQPAHNNDLECGQVCDAVG